MSPAVPLPPPELAIQFGGGDFVRIGRDLLALCRDWGGLAPDAAVLDVGSGAGRLAVALCDYLGETGRYEGFDIYPPGIEWCRQAITPRFPRFRFRLVDVYNRLYYPFGTVEAARFVFPYPDDTFDFVVLNSVFTHMRPADVANYLGQVRRVLRLGGVCLCTFFLLDAATRDLIAAGRAAWRFEHAFGIFHVANPDDPEEAVAYEESFVRKLVPASGLDLLRLVHGNWRGVACRTYQDVIVAKKS